MRTRSNRTVLQESGRATRILAILATGALLTACAQPKTLYTWQAYQPSVRAFLQDDGADHAVQAQKLELNRETARSDGSMLPPGFRAHLGMLYLKLGDGEKAVEQFQNEKAAFPESGPFMDFLLRTSGAPASAFAAAPSASSPATDKAP